MYQTQPAERQTNLKTVLAINIKAARLSRGMTQRELARLALIDRNHLGDLENSFGNPTLAIIERIAKALDSTAASLITPEGVGVFQWSPNCIRVQLSSDRLRSKNSEKRAET